MEEQSFFDARLKLETLICQWRRLHFASGFGGSHTWNSVPS
jgi:hypothetical protein